MPAQRYSYTAITLHWLIALLLAFQIALGWALEGNNSPELFARYQLHKSVGITILLLSFARLAARLFTSRPPASDGPAWTRALAGTVHWLFYLVMILGPITGWLLVSTARIQVPTLLYGIVPWPHLPVGRSWHTSQPRASTAPWRGSQSDCSPSISRVRFATSGCSANQNFSG